MNGLKISARALALLLCATLSLVSPSGTAWAQGGTATATMNGRVLDDTGGVLPGVTVTLTHLATNQTRMLVTNEEGRYTFPGLQPGRYSLTAELPGFTTQTRPELTLNVGAVATIDPVLRVSELQETITVTGEAPSSRGPAPT